jgi:hypothetical protein
LAAKTLIEKFPVDAPDRAIPFCGIGNLFYNMEEYEMVIFFIFLIIGFAMLFTSSINQRRVPGRGYCRYGHLL